MTEKDPKYSHDLLTEIYPCKVPFTLAVKSDKPKKRLGTYYGSKRRIIIHIGWSGRYDMVETAIHEYAHHIHFTEFDKGEKKQAPHGKEFWQIYGQLMCRAKELGICNDRRAAVIDFPNLAEPTAFVAANNSRTVDASPVKTEREEDAVPDIRKVMKDLLWCVVEWLNR